MVFWGKISRRFAKGCIRHSPGTVGSIVENRRTLENAERRLRRIVTKCYPRRLWHISPIILTHLYREISIAFDSKRRLCAIGRRRHTHGDTDLEISPDSTAYEYSPRQTLTSSTQPHHYPYPFERQATTCQKFVFYFAELPLFLSFFLSVFLSFFLLPFQKTLTLKEN